MKQTRWSHFWIDLDDALQQWIGVCRLLGSFSLALLLRWFPGTYVDSLVTAPVNSKLHFTVAFCLCLSWRGFLPFSVSVLLTEKSLTFVAWGIHFLLEFCSSTPIPYLPIIMLSLVFWTLLFSCLWLSVTEAVNGYERLACLCLLLLLGGLFVTGHVSLGTLRQVQPCTFPVSPQSGRGDVSAGYSFLGIGIESQLQASVPHIFHRLIHLHCRVCLSTDRESHPWLQAPQIRQCVSCSPFCQCVFPGGAGTSLAKTTDPVSG